MQTLSNGTSDDMKRRRSASLKSVGMLGRLRYKIRRLQMSTADTQHRIIIITVDIIMTTSSSIPTSQSVSISVANKTASDRMTMSNRQNSYI